MAYLFSVVLNTYPYVNLFRIRRLHRENKIIWAASQGTYPSWENRDLPSPCVTFLWPQRKCTALHFHLCTQMFILSFFIFSSLSHLGLYSISITTLKAPDCIYNITIMIIIPDFFYCECLLCCIPSSSVVYWLLSCGMFVLSQSNVVFTLKPHFSLLHLCLWFDST